MIYITVTEQFGTVDKLISYLNSLPAYYRDEILEVKTYDGWNPLTFKFIDGTFERVVLTLEALLK
jgi:hypothetical protein